MSRFFRKANQRGVGSEFAEQCIVVDWLRQRNYIFTATLNGFMSEPHRRQAAWQSGMWPGVPDLIVFEPRGDFSGVCVEMKRAQGGKLDPKQRVAIDCLRDRGYFVIVAHGNGEAIEQLQAYFGLYDSHLDGMAAPSAKRARLDSALASREDAPADLEEDEENLREKEPLLNPKNVQEAYGC